MSLDQFRVGPPNFVDASPGSNFPGVEESSPILVARASTAPAMTAQLLRHEDRFSSLSFRDIADAANALTMVFEHRYVWKLVWVQSISTPGKVSDTRKIRRGVGTDKSLELARTAGVDFEASGDVWVLAAATKLSAEWSRLTRSSVRIDMEEECERSIEIDVPAGGMDVALWQVESQLSRRIVTRRGAELPNDPLPDWCEYAIQARSRLIAVPTAITKVRHRA